VCFLIFCHQYSLNNCIYCLLPVFIFLYSATSFVGEIKFIYYYVCSSYGQLIVLSPTAPNTSYENIDLDVVVEYSGPQLINSSVFSYAGNPDINVITPKKIRNRFACFIKPMLL